MVSGGSQKYCRSFLRTALSGVFLLASAFAPDDLAGMGEEVRGRLQELYNTDAGAGRLKKVEIHITPEGFFRYRKIYTTGKSEYYSLSLVRLEDVGFLGNTTRGTLSLRTTSDNIIVQTYNDPKGNVDSMTTELQIPLREVEAEDLQLISGNLRAMRDQLRSETATTSRLPGQ